MTSRTIGRYRVEQEVGRGGMATVYRAYDPRFGRQVAVKVLPHTFLHDPAFRARFNNEARTIAGLEHPAIVPVYDFGEHEGQPYLVMQLMTGGTLTDRLSHGPLTINQSAAILRRIGAALDKAHAKGIIHRDLKPGNILFDQDGNGYLSDFGIAKISETTAQLTGNNVIGTPAYMSPEQAQGQVPIDRRSDVYSLGVILFQMLTGNLPYEADTHMGILVKHITDPVPSILADNPTLPLGCEGIIRTAMAKEPEARFPTAGAMAAGLVAVASGQDPVITTVPVPSTGVAQATILEAADKPFINPSVGRSQDTDWTADQVGNQKQLSRVPIWAWALSGLFFVSVVVVGIVGAGAVYLASRPEPPTPVIVSPTTIVAEVVSTEIAMDTPEAPTMTPTKPPIVNSPTPEATATAQNTPAPTQMVAEPTTTIPPPLGPIVFDSTRGEIAAEIYILEPDGSRLTRLTDNTLQDDEPDLSPDGRWVAYETRRSSGQWVIMVMRSDGREARPLVAGRQPDWSPDGRSIAYETSDSRQVWMVDVETGTTRQVSFDDYTNRTPSWSPDGRQLVTMAEVNDVWQLNIIDVDSGDSRVITRGPTDKRFPVWSPDGKLIAFNTIEDGNPGHIWVVDVSGQNAKQITTNGQNGRPAWSPDSQYLLFNANSDGRWLIYRIALDGSDLKQLTNVGHDQRADWGS